MCLIHRGRIELTAMGLPAQGCINTSVFLCMGKHYLYGRMHRVNETLQSGSILNTHFCRHPTALSKNNSWSDYSEVTEEVSIKHNTTLLFEDICRISHMVLQLLFSIPVGYRTHIAQQSKRIRHSTHSLNLPVWDICLYLVWTKFSQRLNWVDLYNFPSGKLNAHQTYLFFITGNLHQN